MNTLEQACAVARAMFADQVRLSEEIVAEVLEEERTKEAFLERLRIFRDAAVALDRAWEAMQAADSSCDLGVAAYPFKHHFEEVTHEIMAWHEATVEASKRGPS